MFLGSRMRRLPQEMQSALSARQPVEIFGTRYRPVAFLRSLTICKPPGLRAAYRQVSINHHGSYS